MTDLLLILAGIIGLWLLLLGLWSWTLRRRARRPRLADTLLRESIRRVR
jgi:hypothetical protein